MRAYTMYLVVLFFFFKQKTAYEMRISDWSSDVCSSDLSQRELDAARRRRVRICLPRAEPYARYGNDGCDPGARRSVEPRGGKCLRLLVGLYPAFAAHHAQKHGHAAVAAQPELCAGSHRHAHRRDRRWCA